MKPTKLEVLLLAFAMGFAAVLAGGCAGRPGVSKDAGNSVGPTLDKAATSQAVQDAAGSNVAPMGSVGAGPMTPVAGTEGVEGGGSGTGSALKEKAKAAARATSSQGVGDEAKGE